MTKTLEQLAIVERCREEHLKEPLLQANTLNINQKKHLKLKIKIKILKNEFPDVYILYKENIKKGKARIAKKYNEKLKKLKIDDPKKYQEYLTKKRIYQSTYNKKYYRQYHKQHYTNLKINDLEKYNKLLDYHKEYHKEITIPNRDKNMKDYNINYALPIEIRDRINVVVHQNMLELKSENIYKSSDYHNIYNTHKRQIIKEEFPDFYDLYYVKRNQVRVGRRVKLDE